MARRLERETEKNQYTEPVVSILSRHIPPPPPGENPAWRSQLAKINERAWLILELGTMQKLSLKKTGMQAASISRGRVHQIVKQAQERLHISISSLSPFLDCLEERSGILQNTLGDAPLGLETLVHYLSSGSISQGLILDERMVRQLVILIRSLALYQNPWFRDEIELRWRTFAWSNHP